MHLVPSFLLYTCTTALATVAAYALFIVDPPSLPASQVLRWVLAFQTLTAIVLTLIFNTSPRSMN